MEREESGRWMVLDPERDERLEGEMRRDSRRREPLSLFREREEREL